MIFVMLGTQDKQFLRLLEAIEKEIKNNLITEKVIVQAGHTKYKTKKMEIFDFDSKQNIEKYIKEADIIITHAGEGSVLESVLMHKPTIAVARLKKYKEHVNDHQTQIAKQMSKKGYIIFCEDLEKLANCIKKARTFIPKEFVSNNKSFCEFISKEISKYL